jgi:hypothetical protein
MVNRWCAKKLGKADFLADSYKRRIFATLKLVRRTCFEHGWESKRQLGSICDCAEGRAVAKVEALNDQDRFLSRLIQAWNFCYAKVGTKDKFRAWMGVKEF